MNVFGLEYLHSESYRQVTGGSSYTVNVTKRYRKRKWDPDDIRRDLNGDGDYNDPGEIRGGYDYTTERVTKRYTVNRTYSYYEISNVSVYGLTSAEVNNEALPGGSVVIESSCELPSVIVSKDESFDGHVKVPSRSGVINISLGTERLYAKGKSRSYPKTPNEDFSDEAEAAVPEYLVRNDSLVFEGVTILDGDWTRENGPRPAVIPDAPMSDADNLYLSGLTIDGSVMNGIKPSTGKLNYTAVVDTSGGREYSEAIPDINSIVVHTPVVCYPELDDISRETQQVKTDEDEMQLVLEETFHINYPTSGRHIDVRGYGDRDYAPYFNMRQVQFPFDAYAGEGYDGIYLPKGTWHDFDHLENTYFLPSWADEGNGHILFRSLAENIPDMEHPNYEYGANTNRGSYKAVEVIRYNISGKVSSLTVDECPDDFGGTVSRMNARCISV